MQAEKLPLPLPEWLPSGWVTEVRERLSGLKDKYYFDPVFGYKFRSKKEVSRYLENGEFPKGVGKKRRVNVVESTGQEISLSTVAKIKTLSWRTRRRSLFTCQSSNTQKIEKGEWIQESSLKEEENQSTVNAFDQCRNGVQHSYESSLVCVDDRFVLPVSAEVPESGQLQIKWGEHRNRKAKPGPCKSENRKELGSVRRTSRRLAGLGPELTPETPVDTGKGGHSVDTEEQPNELGRASENQCAPEEHTRKLACEEPEFKFMFHEALLDPCLSFAIKTLTGAIPVENKLPIGDFLDQPVHPLWTQKESANN